MSNDMYKLRLLSQLGEKYVNVNDLVILLYKLDDPVLRVFAESLVAEVDNARW